MEKKTTHTQTPQTCASDFVTFFLQNMPKTYKMFAYSKCSKTLVDMPVRKNVSSSPGRTKLNEDVSPYISKTHILMGSNMDCLYPMLHSHVDSPSNWRQVVTETRWPQCHGESFISYNSMSKEAA